jgi:hypothetical protein
VSTDADPGLPLFVGGLLCAICLFVAGLTYAITPGGAGSGALTGLAVAIAGLGAVFLAVGAIVAALVRVWG